MKSWKKLIKMINFKEIQKIKKTKKKVIFDVDKPRMNRSQSATLSVEKNKAKNSVKKTWFFIYSSWNCVFRFFCVATNPFSDITFIMQPFCTVFVIEVDELSSICRTMIPIKLMWNKMTMQCTRENLRRWETDTFR